MNLRDLQYFVSLIDLKHFGKAAEACFVSQPALSMQIKKLEQELGVTLLERHLKEVIPTTIGQQIYDRARAILLQADELKDTARRCQDPFQGDITLGIFPTLGPYLLPHIVPALSTAYPKLSLYLVEEKTAVLLDQLRQGHLQAAFIAWPHSEASLVGMPLFTEEFLLTVPSQHLLAQRQTVQTSELRQQELLLLDEGHCLREQALSICQNLPTLPHKHFRATSLETLRHMVMSGIGITLLPKLACSPHPNLHYLPFDEPKPGRTIGLLWRRSSSYHNLLEHIAVFLQGLNLGQR